MGQRDNIAGQPAHRQPPKEGLDRTTSSGSKERDFLSNDRRRVEGPKGACASRSAVQGEGKMRSKFRIRDATQTDLKTVRAPRPSPESLHAKELDGHIDVIKP
jgi:hypothetical protein